jgi:hypothetical protein
MSNSKIVRPNKEILNPDQPFKYGDFIMLVCQVNNSTDRLSSNVNYIICTEKDALSLEFQKNKS